jgi:ubiquinone/menaquinone biosynthesis C-methylase UbiE
MPDRIEFPRDLFRGTATFYARFRPPYPRPLFDDLVERVRPSGEGRMLDLACGTGQVALPLSGHFAEVIAVDQEVEMVEEGRRLAADRGLRNLSWRAESAEELDLPPRSCELVTIGSAFHRLDREAVARRAFGWLRPGGTLAILDAASLWQGGERWVRAVVDAIARFQPADRRAQAETVAARELSQSDVLAQAGFEELENREYTSAVTWTADAVIGHLYSTSQCAHSALGGRQEAFEAVVRQVLTDHGRTDSHTLEIGTHCLTGRRP